MDAEKEVPGQYQSYIVEFTEEVRLQMEENSSENSPSLLDMVFFGDLDGVWCEVTVNALRLHQPLKKKSLIVPAGGPDKDAWFAAMTFTSAIEQEIDRITRPV
ncbi:hypothetical protein ACGFZL_31985 [Streptomyces sp. NPDC048182]|uniref:hypothetical protein n=1 Tax=Streptomyces sp. NPDC048182 TaxID=3365507 RepID=UPI0037149352